jgi:hypothetical protein
MCHLLQYQRIQFSADIQFSFSFSDYKIGDFFYSSVPSERKFYSAVCIAYVHLCFVAVHCDVSSFDGGSWNLTSAQL